MNFNNRENVMAQVVNRCTVARTVKTAREQIESGPKPFEDIVSGRASNLRSIKTSYSGPSGIVLSKLIDWAPTLGSMIGCKTSFINPEGYV